MYNILIVEDNDINQKVLCAYLNKDHISLTIAKDGNEAVSCFNSGKYDLILMDIAMPEMDGLQATKNIRKKENGSKFHTPIIAVTASDPHYNKHIFFDAGIDDYLTKPVDPVLLEEKITKHSEIQF
jgi:CheY-like chemotaxis protein